VSVGENQPIRQATEESRVNAVSGLIGVGMNGTEVGLFREGEKYFQTVKNTNIGMEMDMKVGLSKGQFNSLWKSIEGQRVEEFEDNNSNKEIERKFLVRDLPQDYQKVEHTEISQGYMAICEDKTEVRLRKADGEYFETVKRGGGKTRLEVEILITEEQFNSLWESTKGQRVEKTRYKIPRQSGKPIELDIYRKNLEGLLTVEVEFSSEQESNNFDYERPEWFSDEVTSDKRYKNQNLALHGIPGYKLISDITPR